MMIPFLKQFHCLSLLKFKFLKRANALRTNFLTLHFWKPTAKGCSQRLG
jgi:hypothetical protein